MSAGPQWEVVDAGDRIIVRNEEWGVDLQVIALTPPYELKWAHRIAERLNRTEGDER